MLSILLSVVFLAGELLGVVSQSTNATCLPSFDWAFNSQKQSPCVVASSLLAICNNGSYDIAALPEGTHYNGPTTANPNACQCSTVSYALTSACGLCQNRTILMWSEWSLNCPTVYVDSFPESIPAGVYVPGWAYLDVELHDVFNQSLAMQNANITESTAVPQPTSTSATSAAPTTESSPTATPASDSSSSSPNLAHGNAVGGGVVGGIFGAVIIGGLIFCYLVRRRRRAARLEVPVESPVITEQKDPSHHVTSVVPSINVSTLQSGTGTGASEVSIV